MLQSSTWILGALEANNKSHRSLLIKYHIHVVLLKLLKKWSKSSIVANVIAVLSNISNCDESARITLISNGVFHKMERRLIEMCSIQSLDGDFLDVWSNSSIFMLHILSKNSNYSLISYGESIVDLLLLIFSKSLEIILLIDNEMTRNEIKCQLMNDILVNTCSSVIRIYTFHSNLIDALITKLNVRNGIVLKYVIRCIISKNDLVRIFALRALIHMASNSVEQAQQLLDCGILDRIKTEIALYADQMTVDEYKLILIILWCLCDWNINVKATIFGDNDINELMCVAIQAKDGTICIKSLAALNKALQELDTTIINSIYTYDNGAYFVSFCHLLANYNELYLTQNDKSEIMKFLVNIGKICNMKLIDSDSIIAILNDHQILKYLDNMKIINHNYKILTKWFTDNNCSDGLPHVRCFISKCLQ